MKDLIKSKWFIAFVIFVLGITYINSNLMAQKNASAGITDNSSYKQK